MIAIGGVPRKLIGACVVRSHFRCSAAPTNDTADVGSWPKADTPVGDSRGSYRG